MATMEKSKQRKKHKVKPKETVEEYEEIENDLPELSFVDIDFPSTSTSEETADVVISQLNDPIQEVETANMTDNDKIVELASAPSAPMIEVEHIDLVSVSPVHPQVSYPSLTEMKHAEEISSTERAVKLKPFTKMQLKEFYNNAELQLAEAFETEFINKELKRECGNHILYHLLTKYSKSRHDQRAHPFELEALKRKCKANYDQVWKMEEKTFRQSGKCADDRLITAIHKSNIAVFQKPAYDELSDQMKELMTLSCFICNKCTFEVETLKIQIEQKIRETLTANAVLAGLEERSPVVLNQSIGPSLATAINELRLCTSILFSFLRKPSPDKIFANDVKGWIYKLVASQLRVATWQDHLYILFHILRSPSGISSWAANFVQIANSGSKITFSSDEFQHSVTVLASLLLPIKKRNEFLEKLYIDLNLSIDPIEEEMWTIIDSDGEDNSESEGNVNSLKESDLVALIDQIPFENIFKAMTSDFVEDTNVTCSQLLKSVSFATTLVELLGNGLVTYDTERYKQFAKRLGRLIKHTVFYVNDMKTIWMKNASSDDNMINRINIECDTFMIRASQYIYRSRKLGIWQYLAGFPYSSLSIEALWKLYYCLHLDEFQDEIIGSVDSDFMTRCTNAEDTEQFQHSLIEIPAEDLYYLLQAFSNMALMREETDWKFIEAVTIDLFRIGYVNKNTKDNCYKAVKDLLYNIVLKYPKLISAILLNFKNDIQNVDSLIVYIFRALPLNLWHPTWDDFEILAMWLLNCSFESVESTSARVILSRMNWNFDSHGQLFLAHEIHVRMACLITEVSLKHVPEMLGSAGISDSPSNLVVNKAAKEQFVLWCWNMASTLRLHCMDQADDVVHNTLKNPSIVLRYVLELERSEQIYQGVTESRPLAIYFSILISLWGHSVPQICHKGMDQMLLLLSDHRYTIVIRCLQLITPLFIECPDSLSKCDKFKSILSTLMAADRVYYKLAKEKICTSASDPVTSLLKNMITSQLANYSKLGLKSPTLLIHVWLLSFVELPNWSKDQNILGLLDAILGFAYQFVDAWNAINDFFRQYYTKFDDIKVSKSSGIMNLLGAGSGPSDIFTNPSSNTMYLSLVCLELEHEMLEIQTRIWPETMCLINRNGGKISIDNAIKKTTSLLGYSSFPSNNLVLYKLGNLIVSCPIENYLFPILCQQFFSVYLTRLQLSVEEERYSTAFGLADKFYEGNMSLMKKVKKKLMDAENLHSKLSISDDVDEASLLFFNNSTKLYRTFLLWLEDTQLNKVRGQHVNLPPQFDCHRLAYVFAMNRGHWTEFIDLKGIRQDQRDASESWLRICFRYQNSASQLMSVNSSVSANDFLTEHPIDNISKRLKSYDSSLEPPNVFKAAPVLKALFFEKDVTLSQFRADFRKLETYAQKEFHLMYNEHMSLDCNFLGLMTKLYTNQPSSMTKLEKCTSIMADCTGAARILIWYESARFNKDINNQLKDNRDAHTLLLAKELVIEESVKMAAVRIDFFIRSLLNEYQQCKSSGDFKRSEYLERTGIKLFYEIVGKMNDCNRICPLTKDICSFSMSKLGLFVQEGQDREGINLLTIALQRPDLIDLITELLIPSKSAPPYFLQMYKFIVESHVKKCDTHILFVLLSKFDILNWLARFKPKLIDIYQLALLILQGLESWDQSNAALIQDLLRRNLTHLFEYEFPEHYGEILQLILTACSTKKIMPVVLLDLINSLRRKVGCEEMTFGMGLGNIQEDFKDFAIKQNILSHKVVIDTSVLLAHHFQQERLTHGLHGLYPKHSVYCEAISLLLGSIGHAAIVAGVHAYPGILADELITWLWPCLSEMFSPWLIPYYPQNMKTQPANWIQNLNGKNAVLLPWSEIHADSAYRMIVVFESCLQYLLSMLPASNTILGLLFNWYEIHFANVAVPRSVLAPIHSNLMKLPWDKFWPLPVHVEGFNRILQQFIPECHLFTGFVFIRISWTSWLQQNISLWDYNLRYKMLSSLLMIFVKISYEPNAREGLKIVTMLEEAANYPWHLLEYQGVEGVLDWFVMSTEPSIVLKMPSEFEAVDSAVLDLLQVASSMKFNAGNSIDASSQVSQIRTKRILYVRSFVRLLIACGSKYPKFLSTKEGLQSYHNDVLGVLNIIETVMLKIPDAEDRELESKNLMFEIIVSLQVQGEYTSKLFVEAIVMWINKSQNDHSTMISSTLDVIGRCDNFAFNMFKLTEEIVLNYFQKSVSPSWKNVLLKLDACSQKFDTQIIVQNKFLICLHVVFVNKIKNSKDTGEKILLLQQLHKTLEDVKVSDAIEAKLILHWGLIIVVGCEILKISSNSKNQLLTLARYLQVISSQSDGWGDNLLGAIGMKKDGISNRRRIVAKCLSCIIFSTFGDETQDSDANLKEQCRECELAINDLKQVTTNKRYAEFHAKTKAAINLIENSKMLENINENVCKILRLFYDEAFLKTAEDAWKL